MPCWGSSLSLTMCWFFSIVKFHLPSLRVGGVRGSLSFLSLTFYDLTCLLLSRFWQKCDPPSFLSLCRVFMRLLLRFGRPLCNLQVSPSDVWQAAVHVSFSLVSESSWGSVFLFRFFCISRPVGVSPLSAKRDCFSASFPSDGMLCARLLGFSFSPQYFGSSLDLDSFGFSGLLLDVESS